MGLSLKCHLPVFVGQGRALGLPHLAAPEGALSPLAWPLRAGFERLAAGPLSGRLSLRRLLLSPLSLLSRAFIFEPCSKQGKFEKDNRTQNLVQKFFWRSANISVTQFMCTCGSCYLAAQSCLTLCDPGDRSTPGFHVLRSLLEFAQIHVRRVVDAI